MSSSDVPAREEVTELKNRIAYLESRVNDQDDAVHQNPDRIISNLRRKYRWLLIALGLLLVGLASLFGWLWNKGVFHEPIHNALKINEEIKPVRQLAEENGQKADENARKAEENGQKADENSRKIEEIRTKLAKVQTDNLVSRTQLEDILKKKREDQRKNLIKNHLNQFLAVLDSFSVNIDKDSLSHEEYFYVPTHHRLHIACEALYGGWRQAGPDGSPPVGVFINGSRILELKPDDHRGLYNQLFTGDSDHGPGLQRIKVGVPGGADGTPEGLSVRCSMFLQGEGDLSQPDLKTVLSTWEKS